VQFASDQEANDAQAALNGTTFGNSELVVETQKSLPRSPRRTRRQRPNKRRSRKPSEQGQGEEAAGEQEAPDPCVVWVGNIPWVTKEETLRAHFASSGAVKDVAITRDKRSSRSRGWGTVTFESSEAAAGAIKLTGTQIEGREINVELRRGPRPPRGQADEPADENEAKQERRPRARRPAPRFSRRGAPPADSQAPAAEEKTQRRRARPRRQRNEQAEGESAVTIHATPASGGAGADGEGKQGLRPRRRRTAGRRFRDAAEGDGQQASQQQDREPEDTEDRGVRVVENPECHLFVRNVPYKATNEELAQHFAEAGTVVDAKITATKKGRPLGWGTVQMESSEEAAKALELDGKQFQNRALVVKKDKRVRGE